MKESLESFLVFRYIKTAQSIGLNGINNVNGRARVNELTVQIKPVMAGSLHTELEVGQGSGKGIKGFPLAC